MNGMSESVRRSHACIVVLVSLLWSGTTEARVVVSEIMYHPSPGASEFVELTNAGDAFVDLSGWRISDGVAFAFPVGTVIAPGERVVVCNDRDALAAAIGAEPDDLLGDYDGLLSNGGERVELSDNVGSVVETFEYGDSPPYDPAADGTGRSLERVCLTANASRPGNWRASESIGGSPLEPSAATECPPPLAPAFSPIIINEIHYHPLDDADAAEEFVELYNRSDEPIDVHLWELSDAVTLVFDAAEGPTRIEPGGFLLVARARAGLAALSGFTEAEIAGPFAGRLSNFRDDVELRYPGGELAERVEYRQDGVWPARADGLGPSLQRVSAEVSGHLPQNWRVRGCGDTTTCTLVANGADVRWFENLDGSDPGFDGGMPWYAPDFDDVANGWRDGRLAVGYDSRVPAGQPWVLTPSSSVNGLHSILLRIEFDWDPDANPCDTTIPHFAADWDDGYVAWLNGVEIARGGMVDPPGTVPAFDGSYRAEIITAGGFREDEPAYTQAWTGVADSLVPGRNVLAIGNYNSRATSSDLYLSARLTLGAGATSGELTPGMPNSVASAAVPPLIVSAEHDPAEPRSSDAVVITAIVEGPDVATVDVVHDRGAGEQSSAMRDDGSGADRIADDGVWTATLPPAPDLTLVAYRIEARGAQGCAAMFPREGNPSASTGYFVADDRPGVNEDVRLFYIFTPGALTDLTCSTGVYRQGTFVDHHGRVHFDVGVKFRGETACNYPKKPIRLRFNKGDLFDEQSRLNLNAGWNDKAMLREKLGFDFFRDAGVAHCETHLARVHTNDGRFHGCYFTIEDPNSEFLRRNGWDDDGALYKSRTAMLNGSTSRLEPRNDAAVDRITEVGSFGTDLNRLSGQPLIDFLNSRLNVDALIDYQAVQVIIIDGDSVVKNWLLYLGPHGPAHSGSDLVTMFAWDIDLSHGQMLLTQDQRFHTIHPMFQTQSFPFHDQGYHGIITALLERAPDDYYVKAYYGRLWALLQEKYNPGVLLPKIDAYDANTIEHAQDDLTRWRRTWGARGNDPVFWRQNLRDWAVRRHDWLSAYLLGNNATTRGRRFQYTPPPRVKFTEIHYNPDGTQDFEFVEIYNAEATPVDLSGWSIPTLEYVFPPGSEAPASGFVIVARDPLRFAAAHPELPDGVPVFGPYVGNLGNGGDQLRLRDNGLYRGRQYHPESIDVVTFGDNAPWPNAADGDGRSLELRDLDLDNDYAESWQPSSLLGGSPGRLTIDNLPPVPVLDIRPLSGVIPLRVTFDASGSFDPDGDEFTVRWNFDDGVVGASEVVSRTFREAGVHRGTVTLADGIASPTVVSFEIDALSDADDVRFVRGDVNDDGRVDVSDAVRLVFGLFVGPPIGCERSADIDDSGSLQVTDAIVLLDHLFRGGAAPRSPYPECGRDSSADALGCGAFTNCAQ